MRSTSRCQGGRIDPARQGDASSTAARAATLAAKFLWFSALGLTSCSTIPSYGDDTRFESLAKRYVDEFPALHPVGATLLGDHRFDGELDQVSAAARDREAAFCERYLAELREIPASSLSRAHRVDRALLIHDLEYTIWRLRTLREWAWNPLVYAALTGNSIYGLVAREFAPAAERLENVSKRLEQFPRLLEQVRATLEPARVPQIHAETAVKQNRGVLEILDHLVKPQADALSDASRRRLDAAMETAREAIDAHGRWLEAEVLPVAKAEFRIGRKLYDEKLAFTLNTPLSRQDVRERAEKELARVREEMWTISKAVYAEKNPYTEYLENPSPEFKQAIIRACLELAYADKPTPDRVVATAKESLVMCEKFLRERDLISIPSDPVEIIEMPEFRRGVSLAYCDSPGPLDVGQKTFYAVSPIPEDWTPQQIESFLREYNVRSLHDLTIHEAMPGHFLQLAVSNRYPSTLRAVLSSGVFIEGWAVYAEQMMADEGFLDNDPLMTLIARKWYLRGIANAIIDQAIHVEGMDRDAAMRLMVEQTFQEEREAAGKWIRAQLTSAQLATYFVGYQEHVDLRRAAEAKRGDDFSLKEYHDGVLSFGSPPVQYARALLLEEPIPGE